MERILRRSSVFAMICLLPIFALVVTGCGGGGGGGGGGTIPTTTSIVGVLQDTLTSHPITGRTLTVQGSPTIHTVTDGTGHFQLDGVPSSGTTVINIFESPGGFKDGSVTVDVGAATGNPKNVGTVLFDLSSNPPPPPL